MFTGIITHLGKVKNIRHNSYIFIADKDMCKKLTIGASIAVNGVCLTVNENPTASSFSVTVMPETTKRTMLGILEKDDLVNLELPATSESFLAGHIVQGHIDAAGTIQDITPEGNSRIFKISIPSHLNKYIAEKGSIAVNGISLTVIQAKPSYFTVGIIPFTLKQTMLKQSRVGDKVNIETDILAKYIEKLIRK